MGSIGLRRHEFMPTLDTPRTNGKLIVLSRVDNLYATEYRCDAGLFSLGDKVRDHAQNMTIEEDRENGVGWLNTIEQAVTAAAPFGVYVALATCEGVAADFRPVATGIVVADQHGAGAKFGLRGPWLGAGHVFRPYRGHGFHHDLVRARLETLFLAGYSVANTGVSADNQRSLCTMLKAGFRPTRVAPDLDPDGNGAPTVFLHWDAAWVNWTKTLTRSSYPEPSLFKSKGRLLTSMLNNLYPITPDNVLPR
ncbi:MAG: hypothetical protein WCF85_15540 [Rhodospirillaceae bacterium]